MNQVSARCKHCGAALTSDHQGPCPNCGETGKEIIGPIGGAVEVDEALAVSWMKTREYVEKRPVLAVLWAIVTAGSPFATADPVAAAEVQFSPKACEFSVTFPGQPSVRTLEAVGGIKFDQAERSSGDSYLRAECIPWTMDETQMMEALKAQAVGDGLSNWTVGMVESAVAELRGYKQVAGVSATYVLRLYVAKESTLALVVAAPSDSYPTAVTQRFIRSVSIGRLETPPGLSDLGSQVPGNAGNATLPILNQAVVAHDLHQLISLLSVGRSQEELDSALIAAAGVGNEEAASEL